MTNLDVNALLFAILLYIGNEQLNGTSDQSTEQL
jgi:hypothetical protein